MASHDTHVYCTIVAQNYLPQALALYSSIQANAQGVDLVVLVIDGDRRDLLEGRPGLRVLTSADLDLSEVQFEYLATIYDVVELSTSVKPLLLRRLLLDFQYVVYLDPDMYVVSPLSEVALALDENPIVLTPHFLHPIPPESSYVSEVHSLTTGVHNLGFCAVGRGSEGFLDWWWSHLERECLIYPLLGLFVDQKWTDMGANLFGALSLRHAGYNVGPWNLFEREIDLVGGHYTVGTDRQPLRILHFSGFDPGDPEAVSVRLNADLRGKATQSAAYRELSFTYASLQIAAAEALGDLPTYGFATDSSGRSMTRRLRRAYRAELIPRERVGGSLPLAFDPSQTREFAAWRRGSLGRRFRVAMSDAALAAKYAFPDQFDMVRKSWPSGFNRFRSRLLSAGKVRR